MPVEVCIYKTYTPSRILLRTSSVFLSWSNHCPHIQHEKLTWIVGRDLLRGVDLIAYYMILLRFSFRQRKWTLKVLFGPMSIAITNAHKLYKAAMLRDCSLSDFILFSLKSLQDEIMRDDSAPVCNTPRLSSSSSWLCTTPIFFKNVSVTPVTKFERFYVPDVVRVDRNMYFSFRRGGKSTHRCYVCKERRMSTWCVKCNVPLCVNVVGSADVPETADTCYHARHIYQ